jgi:HPt (histidine-containing phosphotransfer) domain-containing protein
MRRRRLGSCAAGLDAGDGDAVRRAAHTLKSNAATFGATALTELCAELEAQARNGDLADGEASLSRIEAAYAAVEPELAKLRERLA